MVVFGLLLILACSGTYYTNGGDEHDGRLITPQNLNDVSGVEWVLAQMTTDNETVALVKDSQTTFSCDENGNVAGKATINRYSGNLKLHNDGDIIWSKAFIMTRMAGPPELMQQEADFTRALMQTSRMTLKDSKLVLQSDDGSTILEFESAKN
jgi:heat shock protein HslJ